MPLNEGEAGSVHWTPVGPGHPGSGTPWGLSQWMAGVRGSEGRLTYWPLPAPRGKATAFSPHLQSTKGLLLWDSGRRREVTRAFLGWTTVVSGILDSKSDHRAGLSFLKGEIGTRSPTLQGSQSPPFTGWQDPGHGAHRKAALTRHVGCRPA